MKLYKNLPLRTFLLMLICLLTANGYSQKKKRKTSDNDEMLKQVFQLHPEYDINKDARLTEGEYRNLQANRDYRKYDKPFKGYYQYISNMYYANNKNKAQALDIMIPLNRKSKKLPVVVFIHGGGWKNGDKSIGLGVLDPFISSGEFIGVTVNYRLSREAKWPAQIHDCKAAIRWLKAHAKTYGIDKNKICVWGTSAGGHITAMMAVSDDVKELEGKIGKHKKESSSVTCVIDAFGPTDFLMKKTVSIIPAMVNNKFRGSNYNVYNLLDGGAALKEIARKASPITWVHKKAKPTLVYHGTADPLVNMEHSESFIAKMKSVGVQDAYLVKVEGLKHEPKMPTALEAKLKLFLRKYLLEENVEVTDTPVAID